MDLPYADKKIYYKVCTFHVVGFATISSVPFPAKVLPSLVGSHLLVYSCHFGHATERLSGFGCRETARGLADMWLELDSLAYPSYPATSLPLLQVVVLTQLDLVRCRRQLDNGSYSVTRN